MNESALPGSRGEHWLQEWFGSAPRARAFYRKQVLARLTPAMRDFIAEQEMFFLATADGNGECDSSFRAGEKGFIRTLDPGTLLYPEYRGNGVHSSLGNLLENPHLALLFIDFFRAGVGLHVNGRAAICTADELSHMGRLPTAGPGITGVAAARPVEAWVLIEVVEAYIHCSKHIPRLRKCPKEIDWGTDDTQKKGGDYFQARDCDRPWAPAGGHDPSAAEMPPIPAPG